MKAKLEPETIKEVEFDFQDLLPIGITLVVLSIVLAYGLQVQGEVRDDTCSNVGNTAYAGDCYSCPTSPTTTFNASGSGYCYDSTNVSDSVAATSTRSYEFNATEQGIKAVAKLPEKLGTIVTIIVAAVIIGILVRYFRAR